MNYMVTGSTGFLGMNLIRILLDEGCQVRALFRSPEKAKNLPPEVIRCKGDILDPESLAKAMEGCDGVFHAAAFAGVWAEDPHDIFRLNVEGTGNVLEAALISGVPRVVVTSSAGVLGSSSDGSLLSENSPDPVSWFSEYERTKSLAEAKVKEYVQKGVQGIIVNPSRIFGPGPLNKSNSVTRLIAGYVKGSWRILPGNGQAIGNYVFVEDVAKGHLLAMQNGEPGERYILGGENLSYRQFFDLIGQMTGRTRWLIPLPEGLMTGAAQTAMGIHDLFGVPPFITPALTRKFTLNCPLDISKARKKLNYEPLSFEEGIKRTLEWLAVS